MLVGLAVVAGVSMAAWATGAGGPEPARPAHAPRPTRAQVTRPVEVPAPAPEASTSFGVDPAVAASVAYKRGDYGAALDLYRDAVIRHPDDAEALNNLGQVLTRLGRPAEGLPYLQRAASLDSSRWAYRFDLARALGLAGAWRDAVAAYQEAERLFPGDYATVFNLALALRKTGDEVAATAALERAAALAPGESSFQLELGHAYRRLSRMAEARAAYERYLAMTPDAADAAQVRTLVKALAAGGPATDATPAPDAPSAAGGPGV